MAFLSRGVLATLFLAWMTVLGLAADRAIIVLETYGITVVDLRRRLAMPIQALEQRSHRA